MLLDILFLKTDWRYLQPVDQHHKCDNNGKHTVDCGVSGCDGTVDNITVRRKNCPGCIAAGEDKD